MAGSPEDETRQLRRDSCFTGFVLAVQIPAKWYGSFVSCPCTEVQGLKRSGGA